MRFYRRADSARKRVGWRAAWLERARALNPTIRPQPGFNGARKVAATGGEPSSVAGKPNRQSSSCEQSNRSEIDCSPCPDDSRGASILVESGPAHDGREWIGSGRLALDTESVPNGEGDRVGRILAC